MRRIVCRLLSAAFVMVQGMTFIQVRLLDKGWVKVEVTGDSETAAQEFLSRTGQFQDMNWVTLWTGEGRPPTHIRYDQIVEVRPWRERS
jgi:hypothetical protein